MINFFKNLFKKKTWVIIFKYNKENYILASDTLSIRSFHNKKDAIDSCVIGYQEHRTLGGFRGSPTIGKFEEVFYPFAIQLDIDEIRKIICSPCIKAEKLLGYFPAYKINDINNYFEMGTLCER